MTIKICANPSIIFSSRIFFCFRIESCDESKKKQIAAQQKPESYFAFSALFHYLKVSIFYL